VSEPKPKKSPKSRLRLPRRFARDTVFLLVGIAVALLSLGLALVLSDSVLDRFLKLQKSAAISQVRTVLQAVDQRVDNVGNLASEYAVWTDTYEFIQGQRPEYLGNNFDDSAMQASPLDFILFFDQNDKPIATIFADENNNLIPFPGSAEDVPNWRIYRDASQVNNNPGGLIYLNDQIYLATGAVVTNTDASAEPVGKVILGIAFDDDQLDSLRELTGIPVSAKADRKSTLHSSASVTTPNLGPISVSFANPTTEGEPFAATACLRGAAVGVPICLSIQLPRDIAIAGLKVSDETRYILNLVIGSFALFILILLMELIRRSRLLRQRVAEQEELRSAKLAAEQLAERATTADRAKGQFLAMMSHEVRTPLNAMLGFADLLAESKLDDEQRSFLDRVRNSGRSLLSIINDILDFSRIEADELHLESMNFDPRALMREVGDLFQKDAEKQGTTITLDIATNVPNTLTADSTRIRQVLSNLIANAVKFCPRGNINASARLQDPHDLADDVSSRARESLGASEVMLRFEVDDDGPGIPEELRPRLFRPFTQADSSNTRRFGGTGLGLAISRKVARVLGGDLWFQPRNRGSTFVFVVRAGLQQAPPVPTEPTDPLLPGNLELGPALIAEDNPANAQLLAMLLRRYGIQPVICNDGRAAVEQFRKLRPAIIFMDVQMPVLDGIEATSEIRNLEREVGWPPTHIIAITADAYESGRRRCIDAGMDECFTKPIHRAAIEASLQSYLRSHLQAEP